MTPRTGSIREAEDQAEAVTGRAWVTTGVVLAVAFSAAAPAGAAVRYAAPGGSGPAGTCPQADPCDLETAVEDGSVTDGDEVVVLPGDYDLGTEQLRPLDAIDLHGLAGQPRPRLTSSGAGETLDAFDDGTAIRHLEIANAGTGGALQARAAITVERVVATSAGTGDTACGVANGALLRDSICRDTEGHSIGVAVDAAIDTSATLRNVTAVAQGTTGWGILIFPGGGADVTIDAKNVVASGPEADVRSFAPGAGDTATATLDHSNYATELEDGAGTATVTDPGSGTNQTPAPLFADPSSGNFHQLAGSPTIDAGTIDPLLGSTDIDGEPRSQGAAPDIGADEFAVAPPSGGATDTSIAPPSGSAPDTSITLEVGADKKQKVKELEVTVSCGDEACEAALAGRAVAKKKRAGKGRRAAAAKKKGKKTFKVKPKALSLTAGETKTQRVRFKKNKKSVKKLRRLLKRKAYRHKTKAKLKVSATDAAGNAATERVKVKLRR